MKKIIAMVMVLVTMIVGTPVILTLVSANAISYETESFYVTYDKSTSTLFLKRKEASSSYWYEDDLQESANGFERKDVLHLDLDYNNANYGRVPISSFSNIESVSFSGAKELIIQGDFKDSSSIKKMEFKYGIEKITCREDGFSNLTALETVEFSQTVKLIYGGFKKCPSLKNIKFKDKVAVVSSFSEIGAESVVIPADSIVSSGSFTDCANLKSVTLGARSIINPFKAVEIIYDCDFPYSGPLYMMSYTDEFSDKSFSNKDENKKVTIYCIPQSVDSDTGKKTISQTFIQNTEYGEFWADYDFDVEYNIVYRKTAPTKVKVECKENFNRDNSPGFKISWERIPLMDKMKILRYDYQEGFWKEIGQTEKFATTFTDYDCESGRKYRYMVAGIVTQNGEILDYCLSDIVVATPSTVYIREITPKGVWKDGKIDYCYNYIDLEEFDSCYKLETLYRVYNQKTKTWGAWKKAELKSSPSDAHRSRTHVVLPGYIYQYAFRFKTEVISNVKSKAVTKYSPYKISDPVAVMIGTPQNVVAKPTQTGAKVTWTPVENANCYVIYYGRYKGHGEVRYYSDTNSFTIDMPKGEIAYFGVSACYKFTTGKISEFIGGRTNSDWVKSYESIE